MIDFILTLVLAIILSAVAYSTGKEEGYREYYKGNVECMRAFKVIECKEVSK